MKKCSRCKEEKSFDNFNRNKQSKDGFDYYCRPCAIERWNEWKEKTGYKRKKPKKETRKKWMSTQRKKRRDFSNSFKTKCFSCGEKDPAVLDWHHLDPLEKTAGVAQLISRCRSKKAIKAEIDKCVCVCSNCHRRIHLGLLSLIT